MIRPAEVARSVAVQKVQMMDGDKSKFYAFTDASNGQTIYVNPSTVRYVMQAGHRTALVFSERHVVAITADLQSVIEAGLSELPT